MSKRRGSRTSRRVETQLFGDPNEPLRLVVVGWMDEMVEMDRQSREYREALVQRLRDEEEMKQQRMADSRHARKQRRGKILAERRAKIGKRQKGPIVRDLLKPTGLLVRPNIGYYKRPPLTFVQTTACLPVAPAETALVSGN